MNEELREVVQRMTAQMEALRARVRACEDQLSGTRDLILTLERSNQMMDVDHGRELDSLRKTLDVIRERVSYLMAHDRA